MELEEELRRKIAQIQPLDERAMALAKKRWDSIAHPLHSLGLLEDAIVTIAGAQGSHQVELNKRCVTPFCADNGVVAQGVTQSGQDVTTIVTKNFCSGEASVCVMARVAGADIIPVDIGVAQDVTEPGLRVHKIAYGTADITQGPAMTREQAADAIAELVVQDDEKDKGSHWTASARGLLSALVLLVSMSDECPEESKHLATVCEVLDRGTEADGDDPSEPLKAVFRALPSGHPAKGRASQFVSLSLIHI